MQSSLVLLYTRFVKCKEGSSRDVLVTAVDSLLSSTSSPPTVHPGTSIRNGSLSNSDFKREVSRSLGASGVGGILCALSCHSETAYMLFIFF